VAGNAEHRFHARTREGDPESLHPGADRQEEPEGIPLAVLAGARPPRAGREPKLSQATKQNAQRLLPPMASPV